MPVTLKDVADRCGVSPSTVSDVLNNRSRTWASAETRRRVIEAAKELGYRPNPAARALRTGKTNSVAMIHHRDGNPRSHFYEGAADVVAALLGDNGYLLHLHTYLNQAQLLEGLGNLIRQRTADAVLLLGREEDVLEQGNLLRDNDIPFVVKGRLEVEQPGWYQVDYDYEGMMRTAFLHLWQQGHRNIAYIGLPETSRDRERLACGFRTVYQEYRTATPGPPHCALVDTSPGAFVSRLVDTWLALPESERPTAAVLGGGDSEWRAMEQSFAYHGVRLGDGRGDFGVCGFTTPNLWLNYGSGLRFQDVSSISLVEIATRDFLLPLLRGETPADPIRRHLPPLEPVLTQGMELPFGPSPNR